MIVDELRAKLRKPYPQHGLEWRTVIAVTFVLGVGLAASLWQSDWQYFSRSGSLVVVIGLYITWKDIAGKVDAAKISLYSMVDEEKSKLTTARRGLLTSAKIQRIEVKLDTLGEELKGLLEDTKYRVRTLELGTVVVGTLVWGFGDLIGRLVP